MTSRLVEGGVTVGIILTVYAALAAAFDVAWWWAIPVGVLAGAAVEAAKYASGLTTLDTIDR